MLAKAIYSACTGLGAVLVAEAAVPSGTWHAIERFGLATVLAVISFVGLVYWAKKAREAEREDIVRMAGRITELEGFQQDKLIQLVERVVDASQQSAEAAKQASQAVEQSSRMLEQFTHAFEARTCVAMSMVPKERREKIEALLNRSD